MNVEQVEHILSGLNGKPIDLVIPMCGHISMSILGLLTVEDHHLPMKFSVAGPTAFLFDSNDVADVETDLNPGDHGPKAIIRLKGPEFFQRDLTHA